MDPIEKDFLELYEILGAHQGVDGQLTRIMGLVAISPETPSLDEIARKTGYSLASVSNKVSLLESIGILRKVRKPGSRKIYAAMEKDSLRMWRDSSALKHEAMVIFNKRLPKVISKYSKKKLTDEQKKKLQTIQDFQKTMVALTSVLQDTVKKLDKLMKEREK
jgi:DNA-binding transcriptional regulator GbsR (MarR family)